MKLNPSPLRIYGANIKMNRSTNGLSKFLRGDNSCHLQNTSRMAFKENCMVIRHKKWPYLECKHKWHHLLKSDPKLLWISFEEDYYQNPPIYARRSSWLLHKSVHHMTKYQRTFGFLMFWRTGKYGSIWKTWQITRPGDIHGLKLELLKWVANDMWESITKSLIWWLKRFPGFRDYQHHFNDLQIWWKMHFEEP